jgi:hypothetical protein
LISGVLMLSPMKRLVHIPSKKALRPFGIQV